MKKQLLAIITAAVFTSAIPALAQDTMSPEGARAYFVALEDGAVVSSPFVVAFGLSGMGVAPAGTEKEYTGHHHLLIDRPKLGEGPDGAEELQYGLPADDNHVHFGGGQTEKDSGTCTWNAHTTTCSGRFKPCPSRPAGHVRGHYDHGGINSSNISILRSGVVRWILPAPYVLKEVLLWFGNVLPMIKTVRLWSGYSSE